MELYEKILKRIEADLPIYDNIEYAKDLEAIAEKHYGNKFSLQGVSQQRELLEWLSDEDYFNIPQDEIDEILEDWKVYNSNCG